MEALELLLGRGSTGRLQAPAPTREALDVIFRSAARAPDHDRMRCWRFIVIEGEHLSTFSARICNLLKARDPSIDKTVLEREAQKYTRSPMLIVSAAHLGPTEKIPEIEQMLSAGAATQNVLLAAHALGYGAVWKTGALAYDDDVKTILGLERIDRILGFIYIGTPVAPLPPVVRPEVQAFVSNWSG